MFANRAISAFAAFFSAGGCKSLSPFSKTMTKMTDNLYITANFAIAHRAINYAIITSMHCAGRINFVLNNCFIIGVAVCTDFSCFKIFANRAISAFTAFFCAGGCKSLSPFSKTMAECVNDSLRYKCFATCRTVLSLGKTCLSTGGSDCIIYNLGVTCGFNFSPLAVCITSSAICIIPPIKIAVRRNGGFPFSKLMTERRNNGLSYKNLVATRTLFAFGQACFSTVGSNRFENNYIPIVVIMCKFCDGRCFKSVTRSAIAALLTLFGFCGFFNGIPFAKTVTVWAENFLCYKNVITIGAVLSFR